MSSNVGHRTRVYVAGPYSTDPIIGTRNAILTGAELVRRGYAPYVPHLNMIWHMLSPEVYQTWLALDFEWLVQSHVVLRLPGESPGADKEVALAAKRRIPVFYSLDDLLKWTKPYQTCWTCGYDLDDEARHTTCRGSA